MTHQQKLQLRAHEALLKRQRNELSMDGRSAPVVASATVNARVIADAGYLPSAASDVDITRARFNYLGLRENSVVQLDSTADLRVVLIRDDASDPIIGFTVAKQR